ncbi:MAG: DUF934 domain-containing protein [Pseudomonadota bacterium]
MAILKDGELIADPWVRIEADRLPLGKPLLLSLDDWQHLSRSLLHWDQPLGLILEPGDALESLRADLGRFQLIALTFPALTDGRPFTQARLLRRRYGFSGELRAAGAAQPDQFLQLHRCGFDTVEVATAESTDLWKAAVGRYAGFYQGAERGTWERGAFLQPKASEQPAAASWAY